MTVATRYRRIDDYLAIPVSAHPQYQHHKSIWKEQRDAVIGEDAIKGETESYLPKMTGSDAEDYKDFLARAVYVNMSGRTKHGLVGSIFRRKPAIEGIPEKYNEDLEFAFTDDGNSVEHACKQIADEIVEVGRCGALLDLASDGSGLPYLTLYTTENILDWTFEKLNGRRTVSRVVLREGRQFRDPEFGFFGHEVRTIYRVLRLDLSGSEPVYKIDLYENVDGDADLTGRPNSTITPTNRGRTFDHIPFEFFGPFIGGADIEKAPLRDIVVLNLSHYRDHAQLQHGRYFTALPIYYARSASDDNEYVLGPNVVWELGKDDEAPGILEFNGHGLRSLENSLAEKEKQISHLGGRLLGKSATGSESDNAVKIKEANEASMLLNIVQVVNRSMTRLLRGWVQWADGAAQPDTDIRVSLNTDFLLTETGAREFRAIQSMYLDGVIPIEVVYDYLLKSEVIPESMEMEEFKDLLNNKASFPNQPDHEAREDGFKDARDRRQSEESELDRKADKEAAEAAAKAAKEAAAAAPPPAPPPPAQNTPVA